MTTQLAVTGLLAIATTLFAFRVNRELFTGGGVGRPTPLEAAFYFFGVLSLIIGWYFNVRYTHHAHHPSYINYTKALFTNWASDSAAQDYIIVNVALLPLWSIVDGRRRGMKAPWIFFVMSLFTSCSFAMAFYLAFVERRIRLQVPVAEPAVSSTS